jgi:hypothetical protein
MCGMVHTRGRELKANCPHSRPRKVFLNLSPHATDADFLDLVRRHRQGPDHRIDNLGGSEPQKQESQQQIESAICHFRIPGQLKIPRRGRRKS